MEDKKKDDLQLSESSDDSDLGSRENGKSKKLDKKKIIYLFSTVGLTAFFCSFYYCSMEVSVKTPELHYFFPIVMFVYMIALTVLVFVYIIYNRGFSRKGITVDMLPLEWGEEKRREFVESAQRRLRRSKWLLVFIIAFLFTFMVEAIALFVLPAIRDIF